MAFIYAGGPLEIDNRQAASAFTKGDLLCYDSASSLSYCDVRFAAGTIIAGVALADSTDSRGINDLVPYVVAKPETRFWLETSAVTANAARVGIATDVGATSGEWVLQSSTNSALALVRSESSTDPSIQQRDTESNNSWAIVSIISTVLGVGVGAIG